MEFPQSGKLHGVSKNCIIRNTVRFMHVREEYYRRILKIHEDEKAKIGSEIMHVLLDTLPHTNIICVYQETGISNKEADEAHKVLNDKVQRRIGKGENCLLVGDMKAGNKVTQAAKNILAWEESGKVRVLNQKG